MAEFYDTLLAEYIKRPGERGMGLDDIASNLFDYEMISYKDITDNKKKKFIDVELTQAAIYSGEDVVLTHKLYQRQQEETLSKKQQYLLKEVDTPFMEVLKKMQLGGVYLDKDVLSEIGVRLDEEIEKLQKTIFKLSGEEFNINSPKQVGEVLFDRLGLPRGKKTKTGWSVSADVLENLASDFPVAQMIVDYRHFSKIRSTYVVGLSDLVDGSEQNLLHTNYNQNATSTGRLSSTNPNLQNIPSSSGIAGDIRKAFVSRFAGGSLMAFDYSQIELRLLAVMSQDEKLLQAFKDGKDIHNATAEMLGGVERKIAKAVNFGVVYGISGFGLAKMIDISVSDGSLYIRRFYEEYSGVKAFFEKVISDCEESGYVETMFGRRRYIKGITDRNKMIKSGAEREAINMPVQGSNADIMRIAMLQVDKFLDKESLQSKMIMQVHDELVFDVYSGEEEIIKKNIPLIMENILEDIPIRLKVDCGEGENWKECK